MMTSIVFDPPPVLPAIVADHLLWLRRETTTTPMHILKLVYLAHGWMLALHGMPLINEPAEAWTYGPIIPTLYYRFQRFGGDAILVVPKDNSEFLDPRQSRLIQEVNVAYQDFDPWALSTVTHQRGTPWAADNPGCRFVFLECAA